MTSTNKPIMSDYFITVKVPKSFWEDHKDRGCVEDRHDERKLTKHYWLTLTEADLLELLSDSHHYTVSAADYGWDMQWLVSSARATRTAIIKQVGAETLAEMWIRFGYSHISARQMGLPTEEL